MDPDLMSLDDTPAEVRQMVDAAEEEIARLQCEARRQAEDVRARAERACAEIESDAEEQVQAQRRDLVRRLKPLQDRYAREGKLDEALAIRDRIRSLKAGLMRAREDPGTLAGENTDVGSVMLFEITGSTDGPVWGTDVYTEDSHLASAAVHAGVLREGERAVVRVSFIDALNISFTGTYRNGIESMPFETWPTGYRISRA